MRGLVVVSCGLNLYDCNAIPTCSAKDSLKLTNVYVVNNLTFTERRDIHLAHECLMDLIFSGQNLLSRKQQSYVKISTGKTAVGI